MGVDSTTADQCGIIQSSQGRACNSGTVGQLTCRGDGRLLLLHSHGRGTGDGAAEAWVGANATLPSFDDGADAGWTRQRAWSGPSFYPAEAASQTGGGQDRMQWKVSIRADRGCA